MSIVRFLTSRTFLKQLVLAVIVIVVLCFLVLKGLKSSTNHGEFKTVPDLTGKSLSVAQIELEEETLTIEIQDSANYNPDYPKFSVIEQEPKAGSQVKENRKIYITVNPSGYRKIPVPDLRQRTFRQAKPTLEALGFKIGKKTYIDNIGKDMVLGLRYDGKVIEPNQQLSKTSTIDFVLGNGNGN